MSYYPGKHWSKMLGGGFGFGFSSTAKRFKGMVKKHRGGTRKKYKK